MIGAVKRERLWFFDNLRAVVILLMVVFHVAMGYTTWKLPWWYVNDALQHPIFDLFILSTDVYIMPVMFLIAGYFAPQTMQNMGIADFWRGKLLRIVLPWLGGVFFIAPLIAYSALFSRMPSPPAYFSFWFHDFFGAYYQQAHYWFLGMLTLFFLLFSLAFLVWPSWFSQQRRSAPPFWFFPAFLLVCAGFFFAGNLFYPADTWTHIYYFMLQPVRFGLYLCFFALGCYAWRNAWFTESGYRPNPVLWSLAALVMLPAFLVYRVQFTLPPELPVMIKAGHALFFAAFALAATFALIALAQAFADTGNGLWRNLSANSYSIYFIHQCVIIPLAYMVKDWQSNIWVKYFGVALFAVLLCFLLAQMVIRPVIDRLKPERQTKYWINRI